MQRAYFIRNPSHPGGIIHHQEDTPESSDSNPPPLFLKPITPPRFPAAALTSLAAMQPLVFVTRYACAQRCRSLGICIHFQFCIGTQDCPDGLVCDRCSSAEPGSVRELAIRARRKCPLHQAPSEKGWVPSRAEDFLATDQQRERCREVLMRSALGLWANTDGGGLVRKKTSGAGNGGLLGSRMPPGRGVPLRPRKRKRADGDDGDRCEESLQVQEWCEDGDEGERSLARE